VLTVSLLVYRGVSRPGSEAAGQVRARDDVLGYLLKHAHLALEHRAQAALADGGVTVRDLGVLRVIASGEAQSQQEAAAVLGVDRTSMVALLDALERQAIVAQALRTRPATQRHRAHRPRLEGIPAGREPVLRDRAGLHGDARRRWSGRTPASATDRAQRERPRLSRRPVKSSSRSGRSRTPTACRRTALPPATKYRSTI
jgi:hypothetical protein